MLDSARISFWMSAFTQGKTTVQMVPSPLLFSLVIISLSVLHSEFNVCYLSLRYAESPKFPLWTGNLCLTLPLGA